MCSDGAQPLPASRTSSAISLDLRLEKLLSAGRASSDDDLDKALVASSRLLGDAFNPDLLSTAPASLERLRDHMSNAVPHKSSEPADKGARKGQQPRERAKGGDYYRGSPLRSSLLRQGSSSASSTEELIGALHSPTHHSLGRTAKSPLPAPPTHLKVCLECPQKTLSLLLEGGWI